MTTLDAVNKLFDFFKDQDVFEMKENFSKIVIISDRAEKDKASVVSALEDMEKADLIKSTKIGEKTFWVLKKSLAAYDQTVTVNFSMASIISERINDFCEVVKDQTDLCDSTNISQKDLRNALFILDYYRDKYLDTLKED